MNKFVVLILTIASSGLFAQPPASRPQFDAFEVATIKPAVVDQAGAFIKMQSAHRFYVKNYTLKSLIGAAYNLPGRMISGGPAWVDSDHYDVVAGTPGEAQPNLDEQMLMLRRLLADRFKLTFHREQKEFSIYALAAGKSGSKLRESTAPPDKLSDLIITVFPDRVLLPARNATMAQFASMMQRGVVDRPIVDQTGLAGRYDFDLEWLPDETQFGGRFNIAPPADEPAKPDLFAALDRQLGLKLEATKGPIQVIVIDRVERPTEN